MNKCIQCKKIIVSGLWCDIDCKKEFYREHYLDSALARNLELKHSIEKKAKLSEFQARFARYQKKNPGKGFLEFLQNKMYSVD